MAPRKTPQQKKTESYEKDRVNRYGENAKSSRKNVARKKNRTNREYRRAVRQATTAPSPEISPEQADSIDIRAKTVRREQFKKHPDEPLELVVKWKLEHRSRLEEKAKKR